MPRRRLELGYVKVERVLTVFSSGVSEEVLKETKDIRKQLADLREDYDKLSRRLDNFKKDMKHVVKDFLGEYIGQEVVEYLEEKSKERKE